LRHVRAAYLQGWLVDPSFPLTWRLDSGEAGSGALWNLLAHVVDLVRSVSGDEFVEVSSVFETFVKERPLASSADGLSATGASSGRKARSSSTTRAQRLAGWGGGDGDDGSRLGSC
jgi:predicted dehydrogenase